MVLPAFQQQLILYLAVYCMTATGTLQHFTVNGHGLGIFVPGGERPAGSVHSHYWAKVWPAAIGLCDFLAVNIDYIKAKKVTELAAGLGLPSLFAAAHAASVVCTDIEPAAMDLARRSADYNRLTNVECRVASWNETDAANIPDVILLSDVNYEPVVFNDLNKAILFYLEQQCTIILSSPQRLMAKPFIEKLLPYCRQQEEITVHDNGIATAVSIFVLRL